MNEVPRVTPEEIYPKLRSGEALLVCAYDSDARFRLMFERSADAVLLLDTATNKFVEYNQATLDNYRNQGRQLGRLHRLARRVQRLAGRQRRPRHPDRRRGPRVRLRSLLPWRHRKPG